MRAGATGGGAPARPRWLLDAPGAQASRLGPCVVATLRSASRSVASDAGPGPDVDEAQLWARWRGRGDPQARARLLELHLPYARVVAASCYGRRFDDTVPFDDFLQLARVGLIEAMERFEPGTGVQFRSFAALRIQGSVLDGLERATERHQQISATRRQREQQPDPAAEAQPDAGGPRGRQATKEQALRHVAEAGLAFALAWILEGTGMMDAGDRAESIPFYRSVELRQLRQRILELVEALPAQERRVIRGHYLQDIPFESIATELGVTRGRVSQVHAAALRRLRDAMRTGPPSEWSA